jgi:hypothetical protein
MNDVSDGLRRAIELVKNKIGHTLLSDEDLLVLAYQEIAKSYTRDEKDYA